MTVFAAYARYYDLLYRDKSYASEAAHVDAVLRAHGVASPEANLLELGCGTGGHAFEVARRKFSVHGVDVSEDMLTRARLRLAREPTDKLTFSAGDARTIRLGATFDAVISLFHVMSYQQGNDDIADMFSTARAHLRAGGLFMFDCWYGPAVLTDRPTVRVRRLEDEVTHVTRISEPTLHPNENIVDVRFQILVRDKATGRQEETNELHRMRYLFTPELEQFARTAGFALVYRGEWMTGKPLDDRTWLACFVAKAV